MSTDNKNITGVELIDTKACSFALTNAMDWLDNALLEDCAGADLRFDRIKIPAGGSTAFEVPSEDGTDTELVKEITCVILYNHPANAYYKDKYTGGNNPPDCSSFDGKVGVGTPGGDCTTCPYNMFGSGDGKSKACKNRRMLYLLRENALFPIVLNLPAGSSVAYNNYVKHLISKRLSLSRVVTSISLKKASSESNIAFSQAVFKMVRPLEEVEYESLKRKRDEVRNYAESLKTASIFGATENYVDVVVEEKPEPLV